MSIWWYLIKKLQIQNVIRVVGKAHDHDHAHDRTYAKYRGPVSFIKYYVLPEVHGKYLWTMTVSVVSFHFHTFDFTCSNIDIFKIVRVWNIFQKFPFLLRPFIGELSWTNIDDQLLIQVETWVLLSALRLRKWKVFKDEKLKTTTSACKIMVTASVYGLSSTTLNSGVIQ